MRVRDLVLILAAIGFSLSGTMVRAQSLPQGTPALRPLFPVAPEGRFLPESQARRVTLPGLPPLALRAIRFEPTPGPDVRSSTWCGLVIERPGGTPQAIVTAGTGRTALTNCDGLREAGPVPSELVPRLALIYDASTLRGPTGRLVVILVWDGAAGQWRADDVLAAAIERQPQPVTSLASLRNVLSRRLR